MATYRIDLKTLQIQSTDAAITTYYPYRHVDVESDVAPANGQYYHFDGKGFSNDLPTLKDCQMALAEIPKAAQRFIDDFFKLNKIYERAALGLDNAKSQMEYFSRDSFAGHLNLVMSSYQYLDPQNPFASYSNIDWPHFYSVYA